MRFWEKISEFMRPKMTKINGKIQLFHRVIVANAWNCEPEDIEGVIHHRNENFRDNRLENLEIMSREKHSSLHQKGKPKNYLPPQNTKEYWVDREGSQKGIKKFREENSNWKGGIFIDNKKEYKKQYYLLNKNKYV